MNNRYPERCVFLGNIPYHATKEDVLPILQSIGTVINLELKKDPVTGQNTGIGFCEFRDKQTAEAARRMNNKKTIKGRLLRIDNPDGGRKGVVAVTADSYSAPLSRRDAHMLLREIQRMARNDTDRVKTILIQNPSIFNAVKELLQKNHLM